LNGKTTPIIIMFYNNVHVTSASTDYLTQTPGCLLDWLCIIFIFPIRFSFHHVMSYGLQHFSGGRKLGNKHQKQAPLGKNHRRVWLAKIYKL